jgi:hypothetical protein
MRVRNLSFILAAALAWGVTTSIAHADQSYAPPAPMQEWLKETASQRTLAPGTTINQSNWQQYKQFMPYGMQTLFEGKYFWKMPADVAMTVGPTKVLPFPRGHIEASEKYGSQTSVGTTPAGRHFVQGYVAGEPFLNPQDPDKGYKILADVWFAYVPSLCAAI